MTDITERLRASDARGWFHPGLAEEAADEIERLEADESIRRATNARLLADNERLRGALKVPWVACEDCSLPYSDDGFADFIVPDDVWARISARDGARMLCANCMVRRAHRIGIESNGRFASGPFSQNHEKSRGGGESRPALSSTLAPQASAVADVVVHPAGVASGPRDTLNIHKRGDMMFKCNCPHEVRAGCLEPECPHAAVALAAAKREET